MLRKIHGRISPATVISTIALFAALGGGYASAFSGSGTLQKGALKPIPTSSSFTQVRSLTGIGSIDARCDTGSAIIRFKNTSGETINVFEEEVDDENLSGGDNVNGVVNNGERNLATTNNAGEALGIVHLVPDDGTKAPQAELLVSTTGCPGGVTVLALNTQQ
jgi:hypothetical protein